ncbi:hypothetical protein QBC43DRAFT_223682 [Cladorrhinum sp. PSN259]|nr:hypothetical protein QBC43DRAFT_223682 [Cladorrhinum sp. PSN259]
MESMIYQAFQYTEFIEPHVRSGHYNLIGPDGEKIIPSRWHEVVQPCMPVTMHMRPLKEFCQR